MSKYILGICEDQFQGLECVCKHVCKQTISSILTDPMQCINLLSAADFRSDVSNDMFQFIPSHANWLVSFCFIKYMIQM